MPLVTDDGRQWVVEERGQQKFELEEEEGPFDLSEAVVEHAPYTGAPQTHVGMFCLLWYTQQIGLTYTKDSL